MGGVDDSDGSGVCAGSLLEGGGYGPAYNLGLNTVNEHVHVGCAFLLELTGTFILVVTVLNSAVSAKSAAGNAAPMAIGWAVLIVHINLIPYTGCGINPARSLGPMVGDSLGGAATSVWVRGAWVYYTGEGRVEEGSTKEGSTKEGSSEEGRCGEDTSGEEEGWRVQFWRPRQEGGRTGGGRIEEGSTEESGTKEGGKGEGCQPSS